MVHASNITRACWVSARSGSDQGMGFALKRAQWQMVRYQGIDRITWTFDPLLSRNAWLNITRLGAVCNTYLRDFYGKMADVLNQGLPTDRFDVDWWVNSQRVNRRLSRRRRNDLTLIHYPFWWGTDLLTQPNWTFFIYHIQVRPNQFRLGKTCPSCWWRSQPISRR